jgi:hypothetical protein
MSIEQNTPTPDTLTGSAYFDAMAAADQAAALAAWQAKHPGEDYANRPKLPFRVTPVGREAGRRMGGYSSAITKREGREAGEMRKHHAEPESDPWSGALAGEDFWR